MQNKMILKILSYIGFVCSGIITTLLMLTLAETLLQKIVAVSMALVMQASSFIFMKLWFSEKTKLSYFYGMLAVTLFMSSIFATLCYQFNQNNIAKNESMLNSESYKKMQEDERVTKENRNINIGLLEQKKTEIASTQKDFEIQISDIKNTYAKKIEVLTQQKNSLPKDYITQRKVIDNKIITQQNELQKQLNIINENLRNSLRAKSVEIDTISSKINNVAQNNVPTQEIKIDKEHEKGYLGFAFAIANWDIHGAELITLLIQIILAIIFEVTAIGLHLAGNTEQDKQIENKIEQDKQIENKIKPRMVASSKDKIGFKSSVPKIEGIKDEEIKKYIDAMFETSTDKKTKGYKTICKNAGIKESEGRRIFESLKTNGAIKLINGSTTIMKDKNQINL